MAYLTLRTARARTEGKWEEKSEAAVILNSVKINLRLGRTEATSQEIHNVVWIEEGGAQKMLKEAFSKRAR